MSVICSSCSKYRLTYRDIMTLCPGREWEPNSFVCPNCKSKLKAADNSRASFVFSYLGVILGSLFLIAVAPTAFLGRGAPLIALFGLLLCHFFLWPKIIKVEKWTPFEYRLWSKNKLLAVAVYLGIPILIVSVFLFTAIYFDWDI